jgi:hypothetical protein
MSREIAIRYGNTGSDVSSFVDNLDVLGLTTGGAEVRAGAIALRSGVDLFTDEGVWDNISPGMAGLYFVARVSYLGGRDSGKLHRIRSRLHVPAYCQRECVVITDYTDHQFAPVATHPDQPTLPDFAKGSNKLLPALVAGSVILDVPPDVIHDAYVDLEDTGHQLLAYTEDFVLPTSDRGGQRPMETAS